MHRCAQIFLRTVEETFRPEGLIYAFEASENDVARTISAEATYGQALCREPSHEDMRIEEDMRHAVFDRFDNLTKLPYVDECASAVVAIGVIEYMSDPIAAMREIVRILAPGGVLLLVSVDERPHSAPDPERIWSVTSGTFPQLLGSMEASLVGQQGSPEHHWAHYGIGCKGPVSRDFLQRADQFLRKAPRRLTRVRPTSNQRPRTSWLKPITAWRARRKARQVQFVLHAPCGSMATELGLRDLRLA